jgi:hypothetical protein
MMSPGRQKNPLDRECADLMATMLGATLPTKRVSAPERS